MQRFGNKLHLITQKNQQGNTDVGNKAKDLIELCKKGDRTAQRRLYESLAPKMFPVCIRYMGEKSEAEDILQEGFITLFTKLDSFSGEGSFEGWARKIFVNTALMSLRRNDALKMSNELEDARGLSSDVASPIENISYGELQKMIASLPAGFRTIFNMYVIEGYSHKEIAEELGISEGTSRSQLLRARAMLQKKIMAK